MDANNKDLITQLIAQNQRLLQNLNTQRHCSCEVSEIIGREVPASTEIRVSLYSDYGRNIKLGEQ